MAKVYEGEVKVLLERLYRNYIKTGYRNQPRFFEKQVSELKDEERQLLVETAEPADRRKAALNRHGDEDRDKALARLVLSNYILRRVTSTNPISYPEAKGAAAQPDFKFQESAPQGVWRIRFKKRINHDIMLTPVSLPLPDSFDEIEATDSISRLAYEILTDSAEYGARRGWWTSPYVLELNFDPDCADKAGLSAAITRHLEPLEQ